MTADDLQQLTLDELDAESSIVERIVDETPEIDPWCSCPDWVLATHYAFASALEPLILSDTQRSGYALLARYTNQEGDVVITGLEPMWGFASPLVTADPATFGSRLAAYLARRDDWDILALPGLPTPQEKQSFTVDLLRSLSSLGQARAGAGISRQVADISPESGAFEGWLERRSSKFRRNLRKTKAAAASAGVSIVNASSDETVFDRILEIEQGSWKGLEASGITSTEMRTLYSLLTARLARFQRLEVHVAQRDGRDIGYILGGRRGPLYRGLQVSYSQEASGLSIGHLLQLHQIEQLTASGTKAATRYDLGMDIEYKQRWADRTEPSVVIVLERCDTR